MTGRPQKIRDHDERHRKGENKERRHPRRKSPCQRPPAKPPAPTVTAMVREAKVHLNFDLKVKWPEIERDTENFRIEMEAYEVIVRATNAGGSPIELEDARARHRIRRKSPTQRVKIDTATNATGTTFKFVTVADHGLSVGDRVQVAECEDPATYNGSYTVATVATTTEFTVAGGASGVAACDDPGVVKDDDDTLHVVIEQVPRPRSVYWQGRMRGRSTEGCWSRWSDWSAPFLPWTGADPLPPFPTGMTLDFNHDHSARHDPLRAIVTGNYMDWDVPGGDHEDDMARYIVQLQFSNDGGSTWKWPPKRHTVRDRDDNDGKWRAEFHGIDRRKVYRFRVCSEDRYNRRGDWGPGSAHADGRIAGWSAQVDPKTFDENPPAPTFVMSDIDRSKLHTEIADPDATWKPRIDYYEWEVYFDTVTAPNLQFRDRFHRGLSKVFPLRKPGGHTVIARVRAYTASDEVSPWGQTTAAPHVPPAPAIGSASFDALGTRHARYRAIVPVTVNDAGHNDNVQTIVVQLSHKIANVTPTVSDRKVKDRVRVGDDPQEALFRQIPKGHYVFVRGKSIDGDDKESPWTSWTAMGRARDSGATTTPSSVAGLTVTTPTPRRLVGEWDDPDDDEVVRWKVTVKKGGVTAPNYPKNTRTNRHVYRVPKPDVLASHSMEVIAVNDMGVESTLGSGSGVPDDDAAGGEGFEVGDIKKMGHSGVPAKRLLTNGTGKSTSTYPDLFAKIGYTYGGSGATFNVPDMNGRHPIGDSSTVAMGDNEGDTETNRSAAHIHGSDSTAGTPGTDSTSQTPTTDTTGGTPGTDNTGQAPPDDGTGGTNPSDSSGDNPGHAHGMDPPLAAVPRGNLAGDAAGPGHTHTIYDRNQGHGHGHTHNSHGHPHGAAHTHGHSHGHGSHPHGHNHGGHGHGHGHGNHPHPHPHDSKKRPHLAVKFIIKALV